MKVLAVGLIYGNKPLDVIYSNVARAGYPLHHTTVCTEGIANALNDGIDLMLAGDYTAVAFLSNDITEPDNWLRDKVTALTTYPGAGIVASSIHEVETVIQSQLIIGNWLISRRTIERVGYFNESMFPYGPVDLDYCERCKAAQISTYYVLNCKADHPHEHASGNEYGYDKNEMVAKYWQQFNQDARAYQDGTLGYHIKRLL